MNSEFSITNDFHRLSLHDSGIDYIYETEEHTIIEFDWGFLKNHHEKGIEEGIVLGKTKMKVKGYKNEKFRINYSGTANFKNKKPDYIQYFENLFEYWDVIAENKIDENNKTCILGGYFEYNDIVCWIDWTFEFDTIELNWNNHIKHEDWLNGHMVLDNNS
ncbi:hypothetical protein ACFS5J_04925 [Flavobacterium chuncheonense]|uniref:Uncharacterized protein n=1 Tax=Flavobacterium chuncheonense TaxID=2026653 RepID=A0ABW5YK55_9FLAO